MDEAYTEVAPKMHSGSAAPSAMCTVCGQSIMTCFVHDNCELNRGVERSRHTHSHRRWVMINLSTVVIVYYSA